MSPKGWRGGVGVWEWSVIVGLAYRSARGGQPAGRLARLRCPESELDLVDPEGLREVHDVDRALPGDARVAVEDQGDVGPVPQEPVVVRSPDQLRELLVVLDEALSELPDRALLDRIPPQRDADLLGLCPGRSRTLPLRQPGVERA